jgi:hypothetical protein
VGHPPEKAPAPVLAVHRTPLEVNGAMLHDILLHSGKEKIYRTLQHTKGYDAVRFPDLFCDICAKIKARRRGLKRRVFAVWSANCMAEMIRGREQDWYNTAAASYVLVLPGREPHDAVYDDDDELDAEEPEQRLEIEYISPVAGRSLGEQPVPRFDIDKLRPFEVMFVDNKDYEQAVRGGRQTAFILYDLKTTAKFKVDTTTKADNGYCFQSIMAMNGVHKLPYHCLVISDGCGSMVHVEAAACLAGLNHQYIPPHEASLNEAEKICLLMWDAAAAVMARAQVPEHAGLFAKAVDFAMYVDLRTATTASRGYLTPYEMIKGIKPDISKLHRFYTRAFVTMPRQKRQYLFLLTSTSTSRLLPRLLLLVLSLVLRLLFLALSLEQLTHLIVSRIHRLWMTTMRQIVLLSPVVTRRMCTRTSSSKRAMFRSSTIQISVTLRSPSTTRIQALRDG